MADKKTQSSKPIGIPKNVIRQSWGYEYTCCGGEWNRGHVGRCGS